ncbi:MAG: twin-arginine translocase TatA/TatE family subunit [Deltaproteobacteria bacterium]|nr:twin-arginine translocase TatA/TatE family subunit [Deltaproteobacteria bacterium]
MAQNEHILRALGGLGPWELILILLIVLLVFGAGKLPQIGDALGKGIRNFKKAANNAKGEDDDAVDVTPKALESKDGHASARTVDVEAKKQQG